jgi:hypothetical protein
MTEQAKGNTLSLIEQKDRASFGGYFYLPEKKMRFF